MRKAEWTLADAPSLAGRIALVTGATGGLGLETALGLARRGAEVIVTGRNRDKGAAALARIAAAVPGAGTRFAPLDLASLASIRDFAAKFLARDVPLDILVNNAGVMAMPERETTADGFERQFGTNYLGHFALTARLLPALRRAPKPAHVVQVASLAHRSGRIDFDDPQGEKRYSPWGAYRQSKLAMLIFALEFARRLEAAADPLVSVAAHPGIAFTDIVGNGPGRGRQSLSVRVMNIGFWLVGQSAAAGALPILFAATAPEAQSGGYYGPTGGREARGPVGAAEIMPQALDSETARRLWDLSERLTGEKFLVE